MSTPIYTASAFCTQHEVDLSSQEQDVIDAHVTQQGGGCFIVLGNTGNVED